VLGAEVAEQLVKLGLEVSLIGRGRHLMRRELNEPAFERIESLFRAHGVSLHLDDPPARYVKKNKKTGWKVLLSRSATSVEADLLVLCAGMKPRTELAERMGLDVGRGIRVNEYLQTSDNAIFAIGDAAEQADGRVTHLWRDASRQGRIAGRNAVGHWEPYVYLPFRLKCEVFGSYFFSLGRPELERLDAYRTIEFRAGERYAAFYFDDDEAIGVVMMNDKERGDEYMRAIHEGWDPDTCAEFFDAGRIAR
jgi:NAD(P)H-nitrite reductase large subunit